MTTHPRAIIARVHPATPCSVLTHTMPAMQMQQPQRQALGVIQGNCPAPMMQAPVKPGAGMVINAGYHMRPAPPAKLQQQMPALRSAPPREENMVIIEVVRKPQKPDTVHAEVARGFQIMRKDAPMQRPFSGSAPVQGQYSHYTSTKSGSDDISVGKTISVKETTFIRGPMKAESKSFELEEIRAQVQIQPPTPLAVANARRHAEDIKQANLVEQWLANQQPPAAPQPLAAPRDPRSANSDAHSTRSVEARSDAQSTFECEVKNVGSTRAARNFDQMPAPGSFMQGGPGEGPGLVC